MKAILKSAFAAAALSLAVAPSPSFAQEREAPPKGGEPKGFNLPKVETYSLRNGVDVTLVPFGRVPKTNVRAVVRAANLNDGDQTWLADMTAEMMKKGAAGKSASEIAAAAAGMGGDFNLGVGSDQTFAVMDVLTEHAPDAVALIADVLQRPDFPEAELEKVRADLVRNASIARTQAQAQADEAFRAILYPGHPYGDTLPEDGQLEAYTLEDVQNFHDENFGGERTHIYVVGQFDRRQMRRAIKSAFEKWEKGPAPLSLAADGNEEPAVKLIDRSGAPQSTIRLGKRVPPIDESVDLEAADTLLGGYFSSRITQNIREDKGYTYSPNSFVSVSYDAANWQQNADVTSEATGPSLTEIYKEIRRLQEEAPSAAEVEAVQNYMNGVFVLQLATRAGMANRLAFINLHGLGMEYLEGYVDRVQALDAAAFQNAARIHLPLDELSLVVVGPLDTVRGQLEALPELQGRLPAAQ